MFLKRHARREAQLPALEVIRMKFVGEHELRCRLRARRRVLAIVAGIVPAARDIELLSFLMERVVKIHGGMAVLRVAVRDLQARLGVVDLRAAALQRERAPIFDRRLVVDVLADGECIRRLAADDEAVAAGLVELREVGLPQVLLRHRVMLRGRERAGEDRLACRVIDDGERVLRTDGVHGDHRDFRMRRKIADLVDMQARVRRARAAAERRDSRERREGQCHRSCEPFHAGCF